MSWFSFNNFYSIQEQQIQNIQFQIEESILFLRKPGR